MEGLIYHEVPDLKLPTMVVAFAGWPDAAEGATAAVRHLITKLSAKKFAEIDPEDFFNFTEVRPETRLTEEGERVVIWPVNDFYQVAPVDGRGGILLFVGTEPNLKWKRFSSILLAVAERCRVEFVISLGALMDAVPHTREPLVTGRASSEELAHKVQWLGVSDSGYQGPTGIHTAFMQACIGEGLSHASLWGHSPHYIRNVSTPDYKVSHSLLARLRNLVDFEVDLDELRANGETFQTKVTEALAGQSDITEYVRRLEEQYDAAREPTTEMPSSDVMVEELEQFLKSQRPSSDQQAAP